MSRPYGAYSPVTKLLVIVALVVVDVMLIKRLHGLHMQSLTPVDVWPVVVWPYERFGYVNCLGGLLAISGLLLLGIFLKGRE